MIRHPSHVPLSPQRAIAAQLTGIGAALLVALLVLAACNGATPTLHGVAIKNQAVANATTVANLADVTAETAVKAITAGIASGALKPAVGHYYATTLAPKVQAAFDGLKAILKTMETSPNDTTLEKVIEATTILQQAIAAVQSFLLEPTAALAAQGARP